MAMSVRGILYDDLPSWVRKSWEERSIEHLPEGILTAIGIDPAKTAINHAQFHPRYVIFFIDAIEPSDNGTIARRYELSIPFKIQGVNRSRVRVRTTEERIYFHHLDWQGDHDGWDFA